jgi:hypothetical protein
MLSQCSRFQGSRVPFEVAGGHVIRHSSTLSESLNFAEQNLRGRRSRTMASILLHAQDHHERPPVRAKGCHRIRSQARASAQTLSRRWRSPGQSQGGGHKWRTFDSLISRIPLTDDRGSLIALESKAGSPSPPCPASPAEISLERSSTSSTNLPRSGLGSRFGGLGGPEASRPTDLMPSEFLSIFASARLTDAHWCFKVHEGEGGGAQQEAQSFESRSSG